MATAQANEVPVTTPVWEVVAHLTPAETTQLIALLKGNGSVSQQRLDFANALQVALDSIPASQVS